MRTINLLIFKITAFLVWMLNYSSIQAQDLISAAQTIDSNLQLIVQLDQFNLHVSDSYIDCFCHVVGQDKQDPLCQGRSQNSKFVHSQINFEGKYVTETRVCTEVVTKLNKRVEKLSKSVRKGLALIRSYEKSISEKSLIVHMERPMNFERLKKQIIPQELTHLQNLTTESIILEPLSEVEITEFYKEHYQFSEEIRENFILDNNYLKIFEKTDSQLVLNYLKTGQSFELEKNLQFLKSQDPRLASSQWFSLSGLMELYRIFLLAKKQEKIISLKKTYQYDLNLLPLLSYLKGSHPSNMDILNALNFVNVNARQRAMDSVKAYTEFKNDLNFHSAQEIISDYAFVMDHQLSQMYLLNQLLLNMKWTKEKATSTLNYLQDFRLTQKRNSQHIQLGLMAGVIIACVLPYPPLKLVSTGAKLLIRNFCLLGLGGGLNTYYLVDSHSKYKEKIETFLSSADGLNQITKINQVLSERNEYRSWLLFYVFEALPAYEIAKFLLR